jgi:flagellar hook-associated protein 3 FlgL
MRVTDQRLIHLSAAATSKSQEQVADAAAQVSSGMRVGKPSDDPIAWVAAQRATLRRTLTEGAGAAVQTSRDRLAEVDGSLAAIGDAVSQVQTLAIQGMAANNSASDRAAISASVKALFASALSAANARSSDGEFLLAGSSSLATPFDAAGAYVGDALTRVVPSIGDSTASATLSGAELTAVAGVDVLPLLDQVAGFLAANDPVGLGTTLGDLGTAVKQVSLARTRAGGAMDVLADTAEAHGQLTENLTRAISQHVEADVIQSASALARASHSLEASRAVSAKIMSLIGGL